MAIMMLSYNTGDSHCREWEFMSKYAEQYFRKSPDVRAKRSPKFGGDRKGGRSHGAAIVADPN